MVTRRQESQVAQEELSLFLQEWDQAYNEKQQMNPLFQERAANEWSEPQKQEYVGALYHIRGHFHELLWEMGVTAPNSEFKEMIMDNIRDEFGGSGLSHEQMYFLFAERFGLNLQNELLDNKYYYPFVQEYQKTVLSWFKSQKWDSKFAAFCAIERLDNVDYVNLKTVAMGLGGLSAKELAFFVIHINVVHFGKDMQERLAEIWNRDSTIVKEAFEVVFNVQTGIWRNLHEHVKESGEQQSH